MTAFFCLVAVYSAQGQILTVTNTNDNGAGSLRNAINTASGGETIIFHPSITGGTIVLTSGQLNLVAPITIDGQDKNITISGNNVTRCLYSPGFSLTLKNIIIAEGNATEGAGVFLDGGGSLVLENVYIRGCFSTGNGGGVETYSNGTHSFTNVRFSGNTGGWGGGYYKLFGSVVMNNVEFSGNYAQSGGAMFLRGGSDNLVNLTVSGNHADQFGGAFYFYNANLALRNSIFWGNEANGNFGNLPAFYEINSGTATLNISNSVIEGSGGSGSWLGAFGNDGGGNLDADPKFADPLPTSAAPTTAGIYSLDFGSPAFNSGQNSFVSTSTDLAGKIRIRYAVVDRGAYEFCNTASLITQIVCSSYTSPSGNYVYTTSGTYKDTLSNAIGCDSVITINLTVNNTFATQSATACDSYVSPSGAYTWTTSGVYQDTIPNFLGCDSIITLNLVIKNSSTSVINPVVCDSYTSPSGSNTWNVSGTYSDIIPNAVGCDSIININLTVLNSSTSTIAPTVCDTYTSPSGLYTYNSTGTYSDTIPNFMGCDSVITINLTVNTSSNSTISPVACDTYTSPSGLVMTTSTVFNDTIPNFMGCDSVITINLTVNNSSSSSIFPIACDTYTAPSGAIYTLTGTYSDVIPNYLGCDSTITINLTVLNKTFATINPIACDAYTSPSGSNSWTTSGTYADTILNAAGCDSIITINLTILAASATSIDETACNSFVSPSGLYTWTSSGTYTDTLTNIAGCDSVLTFNLTINNSTTSSLDETACNNYLSPSGLFIWDASGTYSDTISNAAGCDSIITINLTINSSSSALQEEVCNSYTSPSGLYTWITSGIYVDTLQNALGCDSIITIDLTVNKVDVEVTLAENLFTATSFSGTYQWLSCNDSMSVIVGENGQSYETNVSGSFAVAISDNGCSDTSVCMPIEIPFEISTAFSPNGDGINDNFVLLLQDTDNLVVVYNRWGDVVREFVGYDDVTVVWDGTDASGNLVSGTYFYVVQVGDRNYSGWVQVIH